MRQLLVILGLGIVVSACASTSAQVCEKLDECNYLVGQTADECTEISENALEDITSAERADCESEADACLEKESCDAFAICITTTTTSCPSTLTSGD